MKKSAYMSTALLFLLAKNGVSTPTSIVGGSDAAAGMFEWFARGVVSPSGTWRGCGGALITKEWVLSAAHCTWGSVGSYGGFQIGALCPGYTDGDNCDQYVEQISYDPSSDVFDHPNYNGGTLNNDFSLIRLNELSTVTPVPIDMDNLSDSYTGGETMQPIGFGATSSGGSSSATLKFVDVPYVTNEVCNTKYSGITDAMMCAGDLNDGGEDACQGDSGGPLYDPENEVLVGVTSWGIGCADVRYPGVYARISNQWEWIKDTICDNSEKDVPSFCRAEGPTSSPTSSPTCASTGLSASLTLTTDDWPAEITWKIENTATNTEVATSPTYTTAQQRQTFDYSFDCLDPSCYKFTISDGFGDGLIETQGGYYSFKVNGEEIATSDDNANGNYGSGESAEFGSCASEPTKAPTDSPTSSPTDSPTASPTSSPSSKPTTSPTESPTSSPTASPTEGAPTGSGCFSNDYKTCLPEDFQASATCTTVWLPNGAATGECSALWAECTGGDDDSCCGPAQCFGDASYAICVPEGEDGTGTDSPTASPTASPTEKTCDLTCDDKGPDCASLSASSLKKKCGRAAWITKKKCRLSCYNAGYGYNGEVCCNGTV